jgi:hypothetical protein
MTAPGTPGCLSVVFVAGAGRQHVRDEAGHRAGAVVADPGGIAAVSPAAGPGDHGAGIDRLVPRLDQAVEGQPRVFRLAGGVRVDEARHAGVDVEAEELLVAEVERVLAVAQRQRPPYGGLVADGETRGADPAVTWVVAKVARLIETGYVPGGTVTVNGPASQSSAEGSAAIRRPELSRSCPAG